MKNKTLIVAVMIGSLAIFATSARAEYGHGGISDEDKAAFKAEMKEKWEAKRKAIHAKLGLSEDQQKQLDELRAKHKEGRKEGYEKMMTLRDQIKEELQKSDFDEKRVRDLSEEISAIRTEKNEKGLDLILKVREILTAEQFNKFMELKEKHKDKRGKWRDHYKGKMMRKWKEHKGSQ